MEIHEMSPQDTFVLQFVHSLRSHINRPKVSLETEESIEASFDQILLSVLKSYDDDLAFKLIVCQSCTKYSSILPVKMPSGDFSYYLVYDQHLNEINRLLNALFLSEHDIGHDIWKLSYELFAEEAIIANDEVLVTYYGLNKIALGPFEVRMDQFQSELDFMYSIQEKYILAHEVGHWLFALSFHKDKRNYLNVSVDLGELASNIREMLQDIYAQYTRNFEGYEYRVLIKEQVSIIDNNEGIVEECIADAIAYAFIFAYIREAYSNRLDKKVLAAQALFLGAMNLQLLAMHHMTVSEESFENETSIRLGFFRNYVGLYFEDNQQAFTDMLLTTVKEYESKITTPMLECFSVLEEREKRLTNALVGDLGTYNGQQLIGLIDP